MEKPPAEPDALTVKQFRTLSDVDLAHHVDQLKAWLGHFYIQTAELSAVEERMTNLVANNSRAFIGAKDVLVLTGENTNNTVRDLNETIRTNAQGVIRGERSVDEKIVDRQTVAVTLRWDAAGDKAAEYLRKRFVTN